MSEQHVLSGEMLMCRETCNSSFTHCVGMCTKHEPNCLCRKRYSLDAAGRVIISDKCCPFSTLDLKESALMKADSALIEVSWRTGKSMSPTDVMMGGMNLERLSMGVTML